MYSIEEQSIEYCRSQIATYHVTEHNTPIHNIISTAPQFSVYQKSLGSLPEDGNVMPKHVGNTIQFSVRVWSTLCDSVWISSIASNRRRFSFSLIFGNRENSQGAKSGEYSGWGMAAIGISPETAGWGRKCETRLCHDEVARPVLAKVCGEVFARFHAKVTVEPGIHSLACWDKFFVLPQLKYRRRHQSGICCVRILHLSNGKLKKCQNLGSHSGFN
jgi:hypothetical protein